jgi:hypothetical protein
MSCITTKSVQCNVNLFGFSKRSVYEIDIFVAQQKFEKKATKGSHLQAN